MIFVLILSSPPVSVVADEIYLVTSALHMRRAINVFEAQAHPLGGGAPAAGWPGP